MRIRYRIALVGGAPVAVAAVIALAAWLLLGRSETVYEAAVLAGGVHRDVMAMTAARIDYLQVPPADRASRADRFNRYAAEAADGLDRLATIRASTTHQAEVARAKVVLGRYAALMTALIDLTAENDALVADITRHATSLVRVTDRARERQHAANLDLLGSLTEADRRLHDNREIVDLTHEMREAMLLVQRLEAEHVAGLAATGMRPVPPGDVKDAIGRLIASADRLQDALWRTDPTTVQPAAIRHRPADLVRRYAERVEALQARVAALREARAADAPASVERAIADLAEAQRVNADLAAAIEARTAQILIVRSTGYAAIQDEVVQLLAYSIKTNDTEQESQNVALVAMRLARRATEALARRDDTAADAIALELDELVAVVRGLPISPLLQDEVVAAIASSRDGLGKTADGLRRLNAMLANMDRDAAATIETARRIDETFRAEAARIGSLLTGILLVGATVGLLLGGGTALVVARSISRPVLRLKDQMTRLAEDPLAGWIDGTVRRDEFGDMARAAAFFVREIGRREQALRLAKDNADHTLQELRRAQADLIQAEKMASLGQLVAGVAHEINTPLGNTIMGASHLSTRLGDVARSARSGKLRRKEFDTFMEGAEELARLMLLNLHRAAELVKSFKQVAADQTSGEQRRFDLRSYLDDLVTSLKPSWRRAGHTVRIDCPDGIEIDGYPGILAQILTNLVMNSIAHGYEEGVAGILTVTIRTPDRDSVELNYTDDGKGIDPAHLGRIFDPFFTTRRAAGNTGLGLHIVYNLVTNKLFGRVAVESAPGQGVHFIIRFPRRVAAGTLCPSGEPGTSTGA